MIHIRHPLATVVQRAKIMTELRRLEASTTKLNALCRDIRIDLVSLQLQVLEARLKKSGKY